MEYNSKFYDKSYILDEISSESYEYNINKKIAIHIHIFYIDMLDVFIDYLKNSPYLFDLLISVHSEENKNICLQKINNDSLKKLNKLLIKIVPNIGRDIAPLLVDFKEEQKEYDFICHVHTKKSPHDILLKRWCDYLLINLISESAIKNIITNFMQNESIGIVFPPIFYEISDIILIDTDKQNMRKLLNRMNINFIPDSNNFIFPAGSMFWYKPDSLKSLFLLNLTHDDFPKEPISATGTIAHAIERLFGIVAEHNGYKIRCYIDRKELIYSLYNSYDLHYKLKSEYKLNEKIKLNCNWWTIFGISNNSEYLKLTLFGIKIIIKMTPERIDKISCWIPIRKWKDKFRNKFFDKFI